MILHVFQECQQFLAQNILVSVKVNQGFFLFFWQLLKNKTEKRFVGFRQGFTIQGDVMMTFNIFCICVYHLWHQIKPTHSPHLNSPHFIWLIFFQFLSSFPTSLFLWIFIPVVINHFKEHYTITSNRFLTVKAFLNKTTKTRLQLWFQILSQ